MQACPQGFVLSQGATCVACPGGTSAPEGATSLVDECVACPEGTYANASSQGLCAPCPTGTTSLRGSFHCVPICPSGSCAKDGQTCTPTTRAWQVITPVFMPTGGTYMRAAAVGAGGHIFYTDGNTLMYLVDNCPPNVKLSEADACQLHGADLLEQVVCGGGSSTCLRGFSALAFSHAPVGIQTLTFRLNNNNGVDALDSSSLIAPNTKANTGQLIWLLYVASAATHSVYRFPILLMDDGSGMVDVARTRLLLRLTLQTYDNELTAMLQSGTDEPSLLAVRSAFAAFYNATHADAFPDNTGCEGWLLLGRSGASGAGQGYFWAGPLLNAPVELELASDDHALIISDFLNQRLCVADFRTGRLRTILGTGAACWNFGPADPARCAGTRLCGQGCASIAGPLGIGLAADDSALYVVINQQNALGVLPWPFAPTPGEFGLFCALNYDNAAR